jgi:hypothetical protein
MNKMITAAAAASLLMLGTTTLIAQQKDGNAPVDKQIEKEGGKAPTTVAPGAAVKDDKLQKDGNGPIDPVDKSAKGKEGVGTRALGATKDEKPTTPDMPKQNEIQKLDKDGRGGQQK